MHCEPCTHHNLVGKVKLSPEEVLEKVSYYFDLSIYKVVGKGREQELVKARQMIAKILREKGYSLTSIARLLGGRNHTTIMNNLMIFDQLHETDQVYRDDFFALRAFIKC